MPFRFSPIYFLHYLLKREATQFFTSIAIRNLALGMVLVFEPIYLYLYFEKSLPLTVLFFAAVHILYGFLAIFGGKLMSKIGVKHVMLFSHFFFFGYYLCLSLFYQSSLLIPLAILLKAGGMTLFWPAFHVDFCRFSERNHQGMEVGKLNIACLAPTLISPLIGGWILSVFNYPVLFTVVFVVLLASAIPMFLSKEVPIVYSDSYKDIWRRFSKKINKKINIAFMTQGIEWGVQLYFWPIFMSILAIEYSQMGGITTFSLIMTALFTLYVGKLSNRLINRIHLLNIGSILTSITWILKFFVSNAFTALLAHSFYRVCRTAAGIPYQTLFYERSSLKGAEMDEFIVYRETVFHLSRGLLFVFLAVFFLVFPYVNLTFIMAAMASLGFMFIGVPPKTLRSLKWLKKRNGLFFISKNK